jgi:hypothetical protein
MVEIPTLWVAKGVRVKSEYKPQTRVAAGTPSDSGRRLRTRQPFEWCNDASAEKGAKAPRQHFAKYQD